MKRRAESLANWRDPADQFTDWILVEEDYAKINLIFLHRNAVENAERSRRTRPCEFRRRFFN